MHRLSLFYHTIQVFFPVAVVDILQLFDEMTALRNKF